MSVMNDEPAIVPELILNISDSSDQDVSVEAIGRDVLEFEANRQEKPPTSEMALPDPVMTLVAAAERGAFAHPLTEPWTSKIELLGKKVGLAEQKQFWMLRLRKIDMGAILVLANMLQARVLDRVTIRTVSPEGAEPGLPRLTSIAALTFPQIVPRQPFTVDYAPERLSRERSVEIVFTREAASFADEVYSALEHWSTILMLGGYPPTGTPSYQSAAVAEPAFLLDPQTVLLEFPDLFLCDENCFAGLVNLTRTLHQTLCPVQTLVIR